ncbi:hypothetical protein DKY63_00805 [Pseudomonas putida]|uniref:Uncharacterized protein n=2 Tax=Pseudomonas putida TaxID=303 RepID=A0A2Z4RCD6_PSEPU|nr:hypothetical protein DKY63_00805 [Pseudomonas putida]
MAAVAALVLATVAVVLVVPARAMAVMETVAVMPARATAMIMAAWLATEARAMPVTTMPMMTMAA